MSSAIAATVAPQPPLEVLRLGRVPYGEALDFQKDRVEARLAERAPNTLLLLEHEPVVTMGRGGLAEHLHVSEDYLRAHGVELFWVERGGMATFHGPGQLVAYPIIRLRAKDLRWYMETLCGAVAQVLRDYGLTPELGVHGPGVWVNGGKIASVGMSVRRWVTFHGMALNVTTDLNYFRLITPCGNPTERMTSMQEELGRPVDLDEVAERFAAAFAQAFDFAIRPEPPARRPSWLTVRLRPAAGVRPVEELVHGLGLHTVCQEALCPNRGECFSRGTATFIIMGDVCTRGCRYCAVGKGRPAPLDQAEPEHVARAVQRMGLRYAVITSVTRDDLPDGGAGHFVRVIEAVRGVSPETGVEVLVPDFQGDWTALDAVCAARPDVFNHNIEAVRRIFAQVRPRADYECSLDVLARAADWGLQVKSGLMLGLGETWDEIRATLRDLHAHGCRLLTLGQYLAPSKSHVPVARYVAPDEFEHWKRVALALGFTHVASAPLVRSSYRAEAMLGKSAAPTPAGFAGRTLLVTPGLCPRP
jgi:lipoic acid synthetase